MLKIEELHQILASMPGSVTRAKLMSKRKEVNGSHKSRSGSPQLHPQQHEIGEKPTDLAGQIPDRSETSPTQGLFDVALIDVTKAKNLSGIAKDYVIGGEPAALKLGDQISHNALVVILFKLGDVCAIAGKLHYWRKGRFDRVFLFKPMGSTDVTDEIAIAVCGEDKEDRFDQFFFSSPDTVPLEACLNLLAEFQGAKLYLFAETSAEGWTAVCGDENWKLELAQAS